MSGKSPNAEVQIEVFYQEQAGVVKSLVLGDKYRKNGSLRTAHALGISIEGEITRCEMWSIGPYN